MVGRRVLRGDCRNDVVGKRSQELRWYDMDGSVSWVCLAWWMATSRPTLAKGSMEAIFVDVGHGTCVVLRFGRDDVWLYDCGRLGNDTYSSRGIDSVLWSLGVTRLNGVFLSHADADHFNALPGVLRRFEVRSIYTPPELFKDPAARFDVVRKAVQSREAGGDRECKADRRSRWWATSCKCCTRRRHRVEGTDNANSLVLRIDGGRKDVDSTR